MAVTSDDQTTTVCSHWYSDGTHKAFRESVFNDRAIPSSNIDLHFAHCSRNLEKCKVCGDMIPKKLSEEHFLSTHAPIIRVDESLLKVACSLCSETMDRDILDVHRGENCPRRIATCEYCEFPLPAIDLLEHQEVCGNRTELCHVCQKYIRLRERYGHESRCSGVVDNTAESSRNMRPPERGGGAPRRQQREFSTKRLLFTIAITGIAVLLGSLFFQRKPDHNQVH